MNSGPARRSVPLPDDVMPPRIGKIRLGTAEATGRTTSYGAAITRPRAADHFVVAVDESEITLAETVEAFRKVYGDEPRRIRAMLIGDTPEANLEGAWRLYGASKLKRRCDGVTCDERTATGGWESKPCACLAAGVEPDGKRECVLTYTLSILLPDVAGFGVWQLDTGSVISVRRLTGFMRTAERIRGSLAGYEFDLLLVGVSVTPEGDGKAKTVYVLEPRDFDLTPRAALAATPEVRGALPPAPLADDARDDLLDPPDGYAAIEPVTDVESVPTPEAADAPSAAPPSSSPSGGAALPKPRAPRAAADPRARDIKDALGAYTEEALLAAREILIASHIVAPEDSVAVAARKLAATHGDRFQRIGLDALLVEIEAGRGDFENRNAAAIPFGDAPPPLDE